MDLYQLGPNIIHDPDKEEEMKLRHFPYIQMALVVSLLTFISPTITLSIMKADTVSISGIIETVDRDHKFIIVNKTRITIQYGTVIVDENGRPISKERLVPKESVRVEAIRVSKDLFAQKIIIKEPFKKP